MHLIAYISDYIPGRYNIEKDLADINAEAREFNAQCAIKGVLFYNNGQFVQLIEGAEDDLRALMSRIEKDKRHENVEYLVDTPVTTLRFKDWNMESFHLDNLQSIDRDEIRKISDRFVGSPLLQSDVLVAYYKQMNVIAEGRV